MESQKQYAPSYSFEFFPPKTPEGAEKLKATWQKLSQLKPEFFSVTFGAGGSTQDRSFQAVQQIQQESGVEAAPHLSCIGTTRDSIKAILEQYRQQNIKRIVALRGDMPSGTQDVGDFRYANELVEYIREQTGDHFHIEVAAYPEFHPQANSADADLDNFKRKVQAGANSALTQYFYNPEAYFRFVDSCEQRQIQVPIVPGIMPITNFHQLARFSDTCGAEIPRWLRWRLQSYGDDIESIRKLGMEVSLDLCAKLLDGGAPGLHFYTMNKAEPSSAIWQALGL